MDVKALIRKSFLILFVSPYIVAKRWVWPDSRDNTKKEAGKEQDIIGKKPPS